MEFPRAPHQRTNPQPERDAPQPINERARTTRRKQEQRNQERDDSGKDEKGENRPGQ
jgi:hypothetical protein